MIKKIILFFTVCLMLGATTAYAAHDSYGKYEIPIDVSINDRCLLTPVKAFMNNNVTYIPVRVFGEAIGAEVGWDFASNSTTVTKGDNSITLYPNEGFCIINGAREGCISEEYKDTLFAPLRTLVNVFGLSASWDDTYLMAKITAEGVSVPDECVDRDYNEGAIWWLAKIVQIESGYEPFPGRLGVANVIMNRVKSPKYPNTVYQVIFDTTHGVQFPPAFTDAINRTPNRESIIAAKCATYGANNVGESVYFVDNNSVSGSWVAQNRAFVTRAGNFSFYK